MKLEDEIQQKKFNDEYLKLAANILFSSAWMTSENLKVLKQYNLSIQQFNILRILRGRQPEPASVKLLTQRMMDRMSNASRLVDKLNEKGLVERIPNAKDRRQVDITITKKGLEIVNKATVVVDKGIYSWLKNLSKKEAKQLNDLLDKMRG